MAYKISKGLVYIITLYSITSLSYMYNVTVMLLHESFLYKVVISFCVFVFRLSDHKDN